MGMRTALTSLARTLLAARMGVSSVLAMMYVMLFAMLAVGFFAMTGTATQVSHNERRRATALSAAESGMEFMRYQLAQMSIPPTTTEANVLSEVYNDLAAQIDGTSNLKNGDKVGYVPGQSVINIPANKNHWIKLASDGSKFRVVITPYGRMVTVKVIGCYSDSASAASDLAAVQLSYDTVERPTDFFSNGLASKGAVLIDSKFPTTGSPAAHANILVNTATNPPVTIGGSQPSSLAGDITVVGNNNPSILGGSSVGGSTNVADILANHVDHIAAADAPEYPTPDTSIFKQYAVNNYVPGQPSYENITIPPNANPTFNGGTIKGVIYIKHPNQVKFNGNVNITGIIVSENNGVGTLLTNTLTFQGNGGTKQGVEALPNLPQFAELKKLGGAFVLAPGFDVTFTGNFGSVSGHIVGDKVSIKGSSDVSVTGSIVALKSTLTISNNGILNLVQDSNQGHHGLRFSDRYTPKPTTYDEVKP